MTTSADYELLKDAYAIVDGIPEAAIAIGLPCSKIGPTLSEGTVCSPEGWLALHPSFIELGLSISADGRSLEFNGEQESVASAMAKVFRMPEEEAAQLFGGRTADIGDESNSSMSDKQFWQMRIRHHIHSRAFSETLTTMAMAPSVAMATITDSIEGKPH